MNRRAVGIGVLIGVLALGSLVGGYRLANEPEGTGKGDRIGMPYPDSATDTPDTVVVGDDALAGSSIGMPVPGYEDTVIDKVVIEGGSAPATLGMPVLEGGPAAADTVVTMGG